MVESKEQTAHQTGEGRLGVADDVLVDVGIGVVEEAPLDGAQSDVPALVEVQQRVGAGVATPAQQELRRRQQVAQQRPFQHLLVVQVVPFRLQGVDVCFVCGSFSPKNGFSIRFLFKSFLIRFSNTTKFEYFNCTRTSNYVELP